MVLLGQDIKCPQQQELTLEVGAMGDCSASLWGALGGEHRPGDPLYLISRNCCRLQEVEAKYTSSYPPQTSGQVESLHRTYLR